MHYLKFVSIESLLHNGTLGWPCQLAYASQVLLLTTAGLCKYVVGLLPFVLVVLGMGLQTEPFLNSPHLSVVNVLSLDASVGLL